MKRRYEALLILNTKGKEESANTIIERLEGEFRKEGANVEQIQRMDRKPFAYVAGPLESGYYVNYIFEADPAAVDRLRSRFRLDPDVYRQHYQVLSPKKAAAE
jgi:ribosomal protein S6